jgi:hypothetical protein
MNKYDIKPKETVYNGIQFRSLLEAKWACFFDLTGWQWQYEPMEINGRIPDFIIYTKSKHYATNKIIVEVKPSTMIDDKFKQNILSSYANEKCHLLILDENPFYFDSDELLKLGLMSQYNYYENDPYEFRHNEIYSALMKCVDDFSSDYMIFDGMIYGQVERKNFLSEYDKFECSFIIENWRKAQNYIRFKSYNK